MLAIRATALVLAAGVLVWGAGRASRSLMVHRLAQQIESADDLTAARLVRELARFEVAAADSPRTAVALAARQQIDRRLDLWRRNAYLHPATSDLKKTALPLAAALRDHTADMSHSGRHWARQVLGQLIDLAEEQPLGERLALVRTCDEALAALPVDDRLPEVVEGVDFQVGLDAPAVILENAPPAREAALPIAPLVPPVKTQAEAFRSLVADPPRRASSPPERREDWNPIWGGPQSPVAETQERLLSHPSEEVTKQLSPPPTSLAEQPSDVSVDAVRPLAEREEEIWFAQLASGTARQQLAAAEKLFDRGYGSAHPRDARMLLSASSGDRLALVDLTLTSPRLEARKWLWLLAHDAAGEVRAAAIASIATSSDPELIEAALQLSMRDTDPRVAEQSSELRERLR